MWLNRLGQNKVPDVIDIKNKDIFLSNSYSFGIIILSIIFKITLNLPFVLRASKIHIFGHNSQIPKWHIEKHTHPHVTGCFVRNPFLFLVYF